MHVGVHLAREVIVVGGTGRPWSRTQSRSSGSAKL